MSWKKYVINRARKTAGRRTRIYGIEPSPVVADLLAQKHTALTLRKTTRLLIYIVFKLPLHRLKLLWQYLTDRDTPVRRDRIASLAQNLRSRLSEPCRVAANFFERRNYSRDLARVPLLMETALYRTTPHLVVQPKSEQDIAEILAFCKSRRLAVFPRGSGSFAFGGAVPTRNGIVMDFSPMKAILEIDPEEQTVRVQPGARWADVAAKLESYGLVPMTTPTSRFSTVAGWISTGGMGLGSYAYGSVYESVIGVRIVKPDSTIEELDSTSESINDLFGTEGQFGILTEITLRVRPKPEHSGTCLLTFNSPAQAFKFIGRLTHSNNHPSHVVFFDHEYLKKENLLFSEQTKMEDPIVSEHDTVLLHFETQESEQKFISSLNGNAQQVSGNRIDAHYLWSDRYFPLKAQRIGPGLLGSEVVIPREEVSNYITNVRNLARHFNIKPTFEVIVCRNGESYSHLVIVSFSCDYSRSLHYVLCLLFIQLLVRTAVRCGGYPYGIGIWNTPFVGSKYNKDQLNRLKGKKHEVDPGETLNPNKFFKIKGRFFNIPALSMRPITFRAILAIAHYLAPVLGFAARLVEPEQLDRWDIPAKEDEQGKSLLHQCIQRCTLCGSCISVCPAYHITEDELVAGRTKLRMAEAMLNGVELKQSEAHTPFQCLHCGLCEEVCQTHLPLRECYLALEKWLENRFGSPAETIQMFVEKLDSNREFIKDIFGLDLPDWAPGEQLSRVPPVERPSKGGEA